MNAVLALYLIACINSSHHGTCVQVPVIDSSQVSSSDPVLGSIQQCESSFGMEVALKYWSEHPELAHTFTLSGWGCKFESVDDLIRNSA